MIRYLLVMTMIILTPPKGNVCPSPRSRQWSRHGVWDKLAAALSFVESRDDDRAYNATSGALGRWQMKKVYVDEVIRYCVLNGKCIDTMIEQILSRLGKCSRYINLIIIRNKDIDQAIRLHRGLHSPKYVKEVKNKLRK